MLFQQTCNSQIYIYKCLFPWHWNACHLHSWASKGAAEGQAKGVKSDKVLTAVPQLPFKWENWNQNTLLLLGLTFLIYSLMCSVAITAKKRKTPRKAPVQSSSSLNLTQSGFFPTAWARLSKQILPEIPQQMGSGWHEPGANNIWHLDDQGFITHFH